MCGSTHSVVVSYKPPMLVTGVRFPVCAFRIPYKWSWKISRWKHFVATFCSCQKHRMGAIIRTTTTVPTLRRKINRHTAQPQPVITFIKQLNCHSSTSQCCINIFTVSWCPYLSTIHSGYHCSSDPVQAQSLHLSAVHTMMV